MDYMMEKEYYTTEKKFFKEQSIQKICFQLIISGYIMKDNFLKDKRRVLEFNTISIPLDFLEALRKDYQMVQDHLLSKMRQEQQGSGKKEYFKLHLNKMKFDYFEFKICMNSKRNIFSFFISL